MTYKEQLADPRWQKKRLHIFERDKFTCQICLDTETNLQVHHTKYDYSKMAWDYPDYIYQTLCEDCHKAITAHIKEHGDSDDFNAIRIKSNDRPDKFIIYSKGMLKLPINDNKRLKIPESDTKKIVQFLLNNWLKSQ